MSAPFDPGLQPERTELAWRRTALAIGVGSLVSLRLLPVALGSVWWVLVAIAGVLFSIGIWLQSRRRLRAVDALLHAHGDRGRMPGAAPLAILALFVLAVGGVGLAIVLVT